MTDANDGLGQCIDSLESLGAALSLPMPAQFHVDMLKSAIPALTQQFKEAFVKCFDENPWEV